MPATRTVLAFINPAVFMPFSEVKLTVDDASTFLKRVLCKSSNFDKVHCRLIQTYFVSAIFNITPLAVIGTYIKSTY